MKSNYPKQLTVSVTSKCNLRCKLCFQSEYNSDLDPDLLDKMTHVYPELEWFHPIGGEPLLYDLAQLYALPLSEHCKFKLITNGTLINPKNAAGIVKNIHRLIISIDGGTQDAYRAMRGYSLNKVFKNIKLIQLYKSNTGNQLPRIEFNFLMTRTTIETLPELACYAGTHGIDCINTFYPSYHDPILKDTEKIGKTDTRMPIQEANKYVEIIQPEKRGGEKCQRPWNTCFVDVTGDVFLCCFGTPCLGNLNTMTFDECWFGSTATHIRKTVNTPDEMAQCKRCPVK
jgi:sulfatase maturation enzyme AslB (radical SAM superfamily)